jgi:hypothetical protein
MQEFDIFLEGTWSFCNVFEANSKEEAIEKAMLEVDERAIPIDIYHTNQWLDGDEDKRKKEILISNLETGAINPYHRCQDDEENIICSMKNGELPGPKILNRPKRT